MEKSKVLAISLGAVALTTTTVVAPAILTSCNGENETLITDVLVKQDALKLTNEAETKYILEREEGTNNFTVITPEPTWKIEDIFGGNTTSSIFVNNFFHLEPYIFLTKEQLKKWFDPKVVDEQVNNKKIIAALPGIVDKNGTPKYPGWEKFSYSDFNNGEQNSTKLIMNTIKFVQANADKLPEGGATDPSTLFKTAADKVVTISFSLTIKPTSK